MQYSYMAFAYFCLFCLGLIDNSRGPLYPDILKYFQISTKEGALIFSLASLSSLLTAYRSKKWLVQMNLITASRLGLVLFFISCVAMGLSPASTTGFWFFLLASVLLGAGLGIISICINLIINQTSSESYRRRIFAGLHSMYGVASLSAPFIIKFLLSFAVSWREYFLALSLVPLFFLAVFYYLRPIQASIVADRPLQIPRSHLSYMAIMISGYICGEVLISSRLVMYLMQVKKYSFADASTYLSYFFSLLLIGRLLFSVIHLEISNRNILRVMMIGSLLSLILGILYWPFLLFISGIFMSIFFPFSLDWIAQSYGRQGDEIIAHIMVVVSAALVAIHYVFGLISQWLGPSMAIYLVPALHFLVLYILQFRTGFLANSSKFAS